MPDEVNVSFVVPGEPAANVAAWRASPPSFLDDYTRVDESYESIVYEANVTSTFTKLATWGFAKTLYRLTFTFRAVDGATRVNVLGQAHEDTRTALVNWVSAHATP